MASRFTGRDYSTLRSEIIEFLRLRLPNDWDYTNLADPVVIFAESLARIGDQLHYTIDELRRECDVATANRASSVYSYAMREGYKMMLPRGSFGTLSINARPANDYQQSQSGKLALKLKRFDGIKVNYTGDTLYVVNDVNNDSNNPITLYEAPDDEYIKNLRAYMSGASDDSSTNEKRINYANYSEHLYNRTAHVNVVLGTKSEFNFLYNDINNDSTVNLPDPIIDRYLVELTVTDPQKYEANGRWEYVDDVISAGFTGNIYTLTPKFIGGAITLCIEFPTNFRDLFSSSASFIFKYIKIEDRAIEDDDEKLVASSIDLHNYISIASGHEEDSSVDLDGYVVSLDSGIRGYTEYEDAATTREGYKQFVQNYAALLTKDDYTSYLKVSTSASCKVFDHSDNYKENVLPPNTLLEPRVIYILTDAPFSERKTIWEDLKDRSGRSDCIVMIPYGKDPYSIIVKAECFLLGTSVSEVVTKIRTELLKYYSGNVGEKIPEVSMINYLVHKASDKVIRMENVIVRDKTYGYVDSTFKGVSNLSNDDIDELYSALCGNTSSPKYSEYVLETVYSDTGEWQYKKYIPAVGASAFKKFPDKFPLIRLTATDNQTISKYEDIVKHQLVYEEIDSDDYDVLDTDIYKNIDIFTEPRASSQSQTNASNLEESDDEYGSGEFLSDGFTVVKYDRVIPSNYSDYHYMVPVLNQVVVLIKAIGN